VSDIPLNTNAIVLNHVSKHYPGVTALDDVSFSVTKGSVHAFLGHNGAGKSTAMKIITGLIPASAGSVEVSSKIGFLPENPPLYTNMTVIDYLSFVAKIQTLDSHKKVDLKEVIQKCGLKGMEKRMIGNLSKGYKQKVGIAQALVFSPEIIILDEPTVGLDPKAIAEIRDLILGLKDEHTILLSTHQLHEASLICNDVTIINKAKILKTGPLEEVQKSFQTAQVLKAIVKKWDDNIREKVLSFHSFEDIQIEKQGDVTELHLTSRSGEDLRSELLQVLVQSGASPLELSEVKLDLEDIFKKVTSEEIQS
jgi:ABC-2 type transport system ATP-binding protein